MQNSEKPMPRSRPPRSKSRSGNAVSDVSGQEPAKRARRSNRRTRSRPARAAALPAFNYPEELPVSLRRDEIAKAILEHQVVIVSGETGSGKTTQLPKICLELGRGRKQRIGHTQPRRLAATSVARRIAEELQTPLGQWVGYQVRFNDHTSQNTAIKLMTDGILLAETQGDPLLRQYDTIIIDEAHERSLNIDFLLGFLKQLLPKRPELKLIITSATIDAARFARHFGKDDQPAPVIDVTGRLYPVEVVYAPPSADPDEEVDLVDAVVGAVEQCHSHGPGDVLVFLPGEREIRDVADALNGDPSLQAEVLPLYARLSRAEQDRIFSPQTALSRVVLATNVAETSVTVPGIRYVVDTGLARIKRYSWRNKVEQLQIEPISQASANQRAGRCGRIGPGVCIRLYEEADFLSRARFTDPEILRSSLASVILRMKSLGLRDIESFPFVDPPHGRAIADGYQLLQELGALNEQRRLTSVGRNLSRLPVDPRVARMVFAAKQQHCLTEMLIIAAALSVQDPRERPMIEREAANQAHVRFRDKRSEFMSFVTLWQWCEQQEQEAGSRRQFQRLLRRHYLSALRLREWREVHAQLLALVQEQSWRLNGTEATYEQVHRALLTGLLGNIGRRADDGSHYLGTRDIRFHIHPGSTLVKKAGSWIVAGELVETSRLFARCIARVDPVWIEKAAAHLLRRSWSEPRWERNAGQVVANERGVLYGLTIYSGRRVPFGRIQPEESRTIFIRDALVAGDINSKLPFLRHNRRVVDDIERLEHVSRRPDILVDDSLIHAFYDAQIPKHVHQTATLEHWYRQLDDRAKKALLLDRDELMRHDAAGITSDVFPRQFQSHGVEMALDYHFEPGSLRDGVTLSIPLFALNQIDPVRCEWLVPGMLKEKVLQLLRSLPQRLRRHCVPLPQYADGFFQRWFDQAMDPPCGLLEAIIQDMRDQCGVSPGPDDFRIDTLPPHLFMNFHVVDEHGRMLSGGRNLDQLKAQHHHEAQASFQKIAAKDQTLAHTLVNEHLTSWSFGPLPELLEIRRQGQVFAGFPALIDRGDYCDLEVFDDPDEAKRAHRLGLRRLFYLALRDQVRALRRDLNRMTQLGLHYMKLGSHEELSEQIINKALEQACLQQPWPSNEAQFEERCRQARPRVSLLAQELARLVLEILTLWAQAQKKLSTIQAHSASHKDMDTQLAGLVYAQFVGEVAYEQLRHYPRYLQAVMRRIDKLEQDPRRDQRWMQEMAELIGKYRRARATLKGRPDRGLDDFAWMLEELRVALFAQELRTPRPVSVKRLERAWAALAY